MVPHDILTQIISITQKEENIQVEDLVDDFVTFYVIIIPFILLFFSQYLRPFAGSKYTVKLVVTVLNNVSNQYRTMKMFHMIF